MNLFLLPHFEFRRLPALDEHGQMLFESAAGRPGKRKAAARAPIVETHLQITGGNGEVPPQSVESPSEFPLSETLPDQLRNWELHITQATFIELMTYFWNRTPEAAGVLFGPIDDEPLVTRFIPDHLGRSTPVSFELHTPSLNQILQELKSKCETCKGVVHSHPGGATALSHGDLAYLQRLFSRPANSEATHLFMPIVCDGRLYPYVYADRGISAATLVLV